MSSPPVTSYPPPVQPQHGQYAPPQAPQYGQYAPPPQYGQQYQQPYYGQVPPGAPPQVQWAPAPKPGLVPLRPLGFGTLLGAPFRVLRRNAGPTFGSALIIQFAILLISAGVVGAAAFFAFGRVSSASEADRDQIATGSFVLVGLSALIPVAVALITSALLQAILVIEVSREIVGEKRRMGELWRAASKRLWPLVLWILIEAVVVIVVLGVGVGIVALLASLGQVGIVFAVIVGILFFLGLVVLAAWLTTKLSLVPCAIVLEQLGVRAGIRRSWGLTTGSFWKTLGVEWLVNVIVYAASQVVSQPIGIIFSLVVGVALPNGFGDAAASDTGELVLAGAVYLLIVVVQLVFGAITAVLQAATVAVIYVDLRMRREGLDIELIRFVEARQAGQVSPTDDPFRSPVATGAAAGPGQA